MKEKRFLGVVMTLRLFKVNVSLEQKFNQSLDFYALFFLLIKFQDSDSKKIFEMTSAQKFERKINLLIFIATFSAASF